jgi:hypothetical protein
LGYSEQAFRIGLGSPDDSVIERCAHGMADLADLFDDFYEADQWRWRATHLPELPTDATQRSALGKRLVESPVEEWFLRVAGRGDYTARDSGSLIIDHEHVVFRYDGINYYQSTTRSLTNGSAEAIDRYPFRIAVDRYPREPEKSQRQYEKYPFAVADSAISGWHESPEHDREPMDWEVQQDLPSFKEIWLLFKNGERKFPLLPGQSCIISYEYAATDRHWGPWSKRMIRIPTHKLSLEFTFPRELGPEMESSETSITATPTPLTLTERQEDDRTIFTWEKVDPPLNAQYRFDWRFAKDPMRGSRTAANPSLPGHGPTPRTLGVCSVLGYYGFGVLCLSLSLFP